MDTGLGRFLSEDPLGFGGDLHLYSYTGNSPTNATDPSGYYPVTATLQHPAAAAVQLLVGGAVITATPEHPFQAAEYGWVAAADLHRGLHLRRADGRTSAIQATRRVVASQPMYNLTVAGAHTFAVGDSQWLVHNDCIPAVPEGGPPGGWPVIKEGSTGGYTRKDGEFPWSVREQAFLENPYRICAYCHQQAGHSAQVDHVIPRSRGGDTTIDNALLACPHCNQSKGARGLFPKSPPPTYKGEWPPPWWPK